MQGPHRSPFTRGERRELGVGCDDVGGKPRQELAARGEPTVEVHRAPVVPEQAGREAPVLGHLRVANCFDRMPAFGPPPGGDGVQARQLLRGGPSQLECEQIREQVVVAKPGSLRVQRDHERACVFELGEDPVGSRASRQPVSERSVDPVEYRSSQQQPSHLLRLTLEHLGQQVFGHRPLAAREAPCEVLGVRIPGHRESREPQTRRPPLGRPHERLERVVGQPHPRRLHQRA